MIREGGYDVIELLPATKGMNQNTAPELLKTDYSLYINNIMPDSLGEGRVRYGTASFYDVPAPNASDRIIEAFPFSSATGARQQVLYWNGFQNFAEYSNFRITSSNTIVITSPNASDFKPDTLIRVAYNDLNGNSEETYQVETITPVVGHADTVEIKVQDNGFPANLSEFYIDQLDANAHYISSTQFSITVPDDFIASIYFYAGQKLKLSTDLDSVTVTIAPNGVDDTVEGEITFTATLPDVPVFDDGAIDVAYESKTPLLTLVYNSYGYINVLDEATKTILPGGSQSLTNVSVACVPRAEFFGKRLWIYNGVNDIMTWDGVTLGIYEEAVKERASTFARLGDNLFSFVTDASFDISKYQNGKSIHLSLSAFTSVVAAITYDDETKIVQITTTDVLPAFPNQNIQLFYYDRPPAFSFMKSSHDRLWCLGVGAVSLEYRIPDQAMRFYYSDRAYSDGSFFGFFNEKTKTVPSEDISAKHDIADNLEAIVQISGNLVFMGRHASQVWRGIDPKTKGSADYFSWSVTLTAGIYHGNLICELANDAQFLSQGGFLSFGTLNIAKQFAASNTPNMDKLAKEYMATIDNNYQYRSCRSFKYDGGGFCGFKIGFNNVIVSRFHTSFFWWGVFSGDFSSISCFLTSTNSSLFLYLGKKVYQYADGVANSIVMYGDQDETRYINFSETKYVNNIRKRYANKRYEIDCDYSSSIVINPENIVKIYISGNLRNTFIIEDLCQLPFRGDLLGTINLVDGSESGSVGLPNSDALGMRLDIPSHLKKRRLKFLSNRFLVTVAGQIKNGPFILKKIRFFGMVER